MLQRFNVSHCEQVTYHTVDCLSKCGNLELLDVSYCKNITSETIGLLKESGHACVKSGKVKFDGCVAHPSKGKMRKEAESDDPIQDRQVTYESHSVLLGYGTAGMWQLDPSHFGYREFTPSYSIEKGQATDDSGLSNGVMNLR